MTTPTQNTHGTTYRSFISGAAIGPNRLVKLDSTEGRVVACSAITDVAIGVNQKDVTAAGEQCTVQLFGVTKIVASAAIAIGAQVMPTASGAGKCATAAGATALSCGVCLNAPGADGEMAEVLLSVPNVNGPLNA